MRSLPAEKLESVGSVGGSGGTSNRGRAGQRNRSNWLGWSAFGLLAAALALPQMAFADGVQLMEQRPKRADFSSETASADTRQVADWVVASGDNRGLPFVIVDKTNAKVFVFDAQGVMGGAAPVLLGLAQGDDSPPGIGEKALSAISSVERITPAGRFVASLGHNIAGQDILWVDYDTSISLHRVSNSKPGRDRADRRPERLASESTLDNRISYGCINVPVNFYENVIRSTFNGTSGIVYVLPETRSIHQVFAIAVRNERARLRP